MILKKDLLLNEAIEIEFKSENNFNKFEKLFSEIDKTCKVYISSNYFDLYELGLNVYEAKCSYWNDEKSNYEYSNSLFVYYDSKSNEVVYHESGSALEIATQNLIAKLRLPNNSDLIRCNLILEA